MTRLAVLMAGPLPPAVGGMASVIGALQASSLSRRVDLRLFETGKTTPEGRSLWQAVTARLKLMRSWWQQVGGRPKPVVHIHTCSGMTFFLDGALVVLARLRGAPTVLHIHGGRFDSFLDGLGFLARLLARWIARQAHVSIVLSEDWRTRLAQRLPGAALTVVENGVPRSVVGRMAAPRACASFVFLGNLSRGKGVDVVVAAAAAARAAWVVNLAGGEGEPGFEQWLNAEIARRGLTERVCVLGPVVGVAKDRLLADSDGFVLPSRAEGLPMALLEAMSAGLPAVVSRVGAMPEVVRDGIEGYVVGADDAQALAEALDRLATDAALRQSMGDAARAACESKFGIEQMVHKLIAVYAQIPFGVGR